MQTVIKQAYQAEVLLRTTQLITVGTRYPFTDKVVLTTENSYQHPDYDLFTYTQRIDVVIPTENKLEAFRLSKALQDYFKHEKMLPLHVGVFQKPYLKENQKARKHFAYTIDDAKTFLKLLPELKKDKSLNYVPGATQVESNYLENGFDLTYQIQDFRMEHLFMEEDFNGRPLDEPFYRLSLNTVSIFQKEDPKSKEVTQSEELVLFHIRGESESEILDLARKFAVLKRDSVILNLKGSFPRAERDYYTVNITKNASEILDFYIKQDKKVS
jgi:hypothetical protein